jgi:Immunoglobulin domain
VVCVKTVNVVGKFLSWIYKFKLNFPPAIFSSGKYHIEEERIGYKVSMLLQIRNFGEEDAGVYMCTSTNSLGKIEGSIRLYQIGELLITLRL